MQPRVERPDTDPHASVRLYRRRGRRFAFEWHLHVEIELTLITKGSGQRFVGDTIERYGPGDFVLLGSETPHTWASDESSSSNEAVVAQFHPDALEGWPELSAVRRLVTWAQSGLALRAEKQAKRFEALASAKGLPRWLGVLETLDALGSLAPGRARSLASPGYAPPAGVTDERARRALAMISHRYRDSLTQAELAHAVGLSPAAFSRMFRRITGGTFTRYLQRLRVSEACRLLIDTTEPVTSIGYASGFQNLSHFNRVFRELVGITPRAYRRQHGGGGRSGVGV